MDFFECHFYINFFIAFYTQKLPFWLPVMFFKYCKNQILLLAFCVCNLRNADNNFFLHSHKHVLQVLIDFIFFRSFTASVSVRNIRNIPKVPLTVKPTDPNDTINRNINVHMNGTVGSNSNNSNFYYGTNYIKPTDSIYTNGQIQQQQQPQVHQQDSIQQQYAVVKKTGSKRDIRENLERENSAMFKVNVR